MRLLRPNLYVFILQRVKSQRRLNRKANKVKRVSSLKILQQHQPTTTTAPSATSTSAVNAIETSRTTTPIAPANTVGFVIRVARGKLLAKSVQQELLNLKLVYKFDGQFIKLDEETIRKSNFFFIVKFAK